MLARCSVALGVTLSLGCSGDPELVTNGTLRVPSPSGEVSVEGLRSGRLRVVDASGSAVLRSAWSEAEVDAGQGKVDLSTQGCAGTWQKVRRRPHPTYPAELDGLTLRCASNGYALETTLLLHDAGRAVIALLTLHNETAAPVTVHRMTPIASNGAEGGLFVGQSAGRNRVLDDGYDIAIDTQAMLHFPDEPSRQPVLDSFFEVTARGEVLSNWNVATADLDGSRSFVAGALTVERAFPTVGVSFHPDEPVLDGARTGFDELYTDELYVFRGKAVAAGASLDAEPMYLDGASPDAFAALESYADEIARYQGIEVWTKTHPVPNGWNSWTGSSGTGGIGHEINEQVISENLAVMQREFQPFGVDYFQIDDGYQIRYGDWQTDPAKFPAGMPAMAQKIEQAKLIPGIWIGAFTVDTASTPYLTHPEWFHDPSTNVLHGFVSPGSGQRLLDLSSDGAIGWLNDTFKRYHGDWRMRWIKLDFGYYALLYPSVADPSLTSVEAYKRGIRAVRDTIGPETHYDGIALMGINWGVVDSMRLTYDNGPSWEEKAPFSLLGAAGSFKGTAKTGSKRYYFNNRVWVTHDDLLFFRTDPAATQPVTMDEATTLASFMALSGSIIKFGEDLRTLTPAQIDVWRKLLPGYKAGARPHDLFTRLYPEIYDLDVRGTLAGSDAEWKVLGFLNWGRNYGYEQQPMIELADEARDYDVPLADVGLDASQRYLAHEFWSETYLGVVEGSLHVHVPAHSHAVIALRPEQEHPQFLGENRHITQGGTDLARESWDAAGKKLELTFDVDAAPSGGHPFEYHFMVHVPAGFSFVSVSDSQLVASVSGEVLTLKVTPAAPGPLSFSVQF